MNIFKNYHIKLLSILSAILLWLFVVGVENYVTVLPNDIPVSILNLGQNVSVASKLVPIKVKYKNPNGSVRVTSSEIELYVDANGLGEGEYLLPVDYISKNPQVTIVAVEPANIALRLEAIATKEITLTPKIIGDPNNDYEVKAVQIDTEKVIINGAASAIEHISNLPIKITLDGTETADFSRKVTLEAAPEWELSGKTLTFEPEVVLVDIEIRKKKQQDSTIDTEPTSSGNTDNLSNAPIEDGNVRKNLMVQVIPEDSLRIAIKEFLPQNILLTVEGSEEEIASLNSDSIKLILNSSSVKDGEYQISMKDLILPAQYHLKIIKFSPDKILIRF